MTVTGLKSFDHSLTTTQQWLSDVKEELHLGTQEQAYEVTRAVLHTLRDRLTVEQAVKLAAQLPMLLQGVYYHGWSVAGKPEKIRHKEEFLSKIADKLMGKHPPEESARAVFQVMQKRVTCGEVCDVIGSLPKDIQQLWIQC
jgi:uncharacterized protein (DUF2267 family)